MINETKKILKLANVSIVATCVRVPVDYCHGVSITVEFENEFSIEEIKESFLKQDAIILSDCPNSIEALGTDNVYVGRIRKSLSDSKTLMFYCVADNIRRGAASNAVLIALKIIKNCIAYKN